MKKPRKYWSLHVTYPVRYYNQWSDRSIEAIVGRNSSASGMGAGKRDLSFDFRTKEGADRAFDKLNSRREDLVNNTHITTREYETR